MLYFLEKEGHGAWQKAVQVPENEGSRSTPLSHQSLAVSRHRPNGEDDNSFPSAHASNVFTLSTVVAHYYGKKVGIPAWIAAGAIALSRVEKGKHWLSDVIAGSTIGFISAITAIRGSDHYASKRNWTLVPSFGTERVAFTFYYMF